MPQAIVYLEKEEDKIIKKYSKKWDISKIDTIKRIIRKFEEKEKEKWVS